VAQGPLFFIINNNGIGLDKFTREKVERLVEKAAANLGYTVYDCVVQLRKGSSRIDVKIDNGAVVSHDDCVAYSRELTTLLDANDVIPDYTIEISSPGLKRKLRNAAEFTRFLGSPVKAVYVIEGKGDSVKGKLLSADENGVTIDDGKRKISLRYEDIKNSNLEY
jgi:ribosome maturation factor RimP